MPLSTATVSMVHSVPELMVSSEVSAALGSAAGKGSRRTCRASVTLTSEVTSGRAALASFPRDSTWETLGSLLSRALVPVPRSQVWAGGIRHGNTCCDQRI